MISIRQYYEEYTCTVGRLIAVTWSADNLSRLPSEIAEDVAHHAHAEHERDKKGRATLYDQLGRAADDTVK